MLKVSLGVLLAFAMVPFALAQTSKALISGIVTDSSGAAITNAKVTITDIRWYDYNVRGLLTCDCEARS